ncbi:PSD1 and planctomycete cytochrome C domain-containing protein [Lacipirellula limnantheis]|nr:PSD1 and planctomycete cytochrome C domain-containing protein [Lacipirellula limnantheis]
MARTFAVVAATLLGGVFAVAADVASEGPIDGAPFSSEQIEFFEAKIRPLLVTHCQECHGPDLQEANLRLDSRAALLSGGDTGAAIEPGQPEASLLIDAVRYGDVYQMPPTEQLAAGDVALLEEWVRIGAPWSPGAEGAVAEAKPAFDLQARKAGHWAWHRVVRPSPPELADASATTPIDAFVLAKLDDAGLAPASQADRATLLRRATFDLTGLPPTWAEIEAFERDESPDAFARQVDRLLASPHFGERWGRHWLDVVRYAETLGHESDFPLTNAWRYRDYVIRALNADVPYDEFVQEHIAGDLFDSPRIHPTERFNESILATAFWYLGEAVHAPVDSRADQATRLENQVDVLTKAFLGLTVACARCHDHKFDAISTRDYYALAGFAASSHQQVACLDPNGELEAGAARLQELHRRGGEALGLGRAGTSQGVRGTLPASHAAGAPATFEGFDDGGASWFRSGWAFGDTLADRGDWRVTPSGPEMLAAGLAHSGRYGDRLPGTLRSQTFTIEKPYLHYRVAGRQAKVRLIVDGYAMDPFTPLLFEGFTFELDSDELGWRSQNASRYMGHRAHIELIDAGPGYLAVDEIVFSDSAEPPTRRQDSASAATSDIAVAAADADDDLPKILAEMSAIDAALPAPATAVAIGDGSGEDLRVQIRGNYKTPGEEAPRRLLEAITGDDEPAPLQGSGRRELAERITAADNPFLARVMANRVWQHLFGRGLVGTVDNFGVLGERPTHPELLDYVASRFVEENWSVKRLIREMMLSDAYQRAAESSAEAERLDPQNRLLHRANVRRLEGEAIRDALLAISDRLDRQQFGPPVPIHLTSFMDGRGKPAESGPLDGAGRRSVYLEVRRNFLSPFLLAFDMPVPATCVGQRSSSNVPAQALCLLNDPFVLEQCDLWAKKVIENHGNAEDRIREMYRKAFARSATGEEIDAAKAFLDDQAATYGVGGDDVRVWRDLCHVLVNLKEFIYLN